MKTVEVAAAIIERDGKILATQRGYGTFKDGWEFPGGKLEPGELPIEALVREIREELDATIDVERPVCVIDYSYDDFCLHMHCFLCHLKDGSFTLLEHEASRWLGAHELFSVDWLPADIQVIEEIRRQGIAR
ncbi:(deoxy)nucleoside triphosphate pyrophosphohydrolase [Cryptobacterium curtum]